MSRFGRSLPLAALPLLLWATGSAAQQVVFSGRGDPDLDRRITAILASGRYTLITHDTTISRRDTLRGPVLAPGISLRFDGTVLGDLVGIAADLFIHPRAVITGDVVNAGGGLYASTLARLGATLDRPLANYTVSHEGNLIRIQARPSAKGAIALDGFRGVHVPVYDRVNALWVQMGGRLRLPAPGALDSAALHVVGGWRTGGPGETYTADLQLRRGPLTLVGGTQRITATQDRWIRGDMSNSVAFIGFGTDYRDYYDSRQTFAALARDFDRGRWSGYVALTGRREVDRSLRTLDTWVLFAPDSVRPNPAVADSTISSAILSGALEWRTDTSAVLLGAEAERAGTALGGDLAFSRFALWGDASVPVLWGHTLNVYARVQGPFAGAVALPPQRWSHVGGSATLPNYPIATFYGDRLAFVSTEYIMPVPGGFRFPLVGPPNIALLHAAGMAWTRGQSGRLEQNIGVEVRVLGLAASVIMNPSRARQEAILRAGFAFGPAPIPSGRAHFDTRSLER